MGDNDKIWFVKTADGGVYGPASMNDLVGWAQEGRVDPKGFVSKDRSSWMPAQLLPELEMHWVVETSPGNFFGPFNRSVVSRIFRNGEAPAGSKAYRLHGQSVDEDVVPEVIEKVVEKEVVKEVRVEVPVEKIVEKEVIKEVRVEVPVEKIVERIVEVQVPVKTEVVVPEVVEPVVEVVPEPQPKSNPLPGKMFGNVDRRSLAALEAAARQELAAARNRNFNFPKGMFGKR